MAQFSRDEVERAFQHYWRTGAVGEDWDTWADLFTEGADYVEHVVGTMKGREPIRAWIKPITLESWELYTAYEWHIVEAGKMRTELPSGRCPCCIHTEGVHMSKQASEPWDLTGKVALITGGSRGLGREIALGFARAGADIVIASRKLAGCEAVAREVEALGRRARPCACHVGDWQALDALVDTAYAHFGKVDVLVNNAGMSPLYPSLVEVSEALWDKVLAVNLKGPFRLSALVGTRMAAGAGGSIINISSVAAICPTPVETPYAAAKAGLNNLTVACAHAFGPKVRVNCIMPGPFLTDISKAWPEMAVQAIARTSALRRAGQPEEIVGAALYFASDASSFTTGAVLRIDGGRP
jgi:NAD(P)-dependent dehydrogenase (short-subunit alcohol dehydrogenase family)